MEVVHDVDLRRGCGVGDYGQGVNGGQRTQVG